MDQRGELPRGWSCACREGWECTAGCSPADPSGHTCVDRVCLEKLPLREPVAACHMLSVDACTKAYQVGPRSRFSTEQDRRPKPTAF